jgi:DNA-binding NtrC family response regulator
MRLLIIGSLGGQVGAASQIARSRGAHVVHTDDIDAGVAYVRSGQGADLILADVTLDVGGLIGRLRSERMALAVVACGVGTDTRAAVSAIKAGARDYLPLPPDPNLIGAILAAVGEKNTAPIHADPNMAAVLTLADRVAASEASVLILGPSGTGKEVLARHLHARSNRAGSRFVAVNCAAIPEALLESELFGHEKGAFTGALARRIGRFEEAHGGTLLLDEISEMDPRLQAKLLRVLQEREITRLGANQPIKINVRILATSNRNLEQAVRNGDFREDLYFRLNVVTLKLPALCDRPKDILLLSEHFVGKYSTDNGRGPMRLGADAQRLLANHRWPGNVRELENTIHRAVLLSSGETIGADAIVLSGGGTSEPASPARTADAMAGAVGSTVARMEQDLIINTLRHCLGNRTHAAEILGISIRTLRNKLKQYASDGVTVPAHHSS